MSVTTTPAPAPVARRTDSFLSRFRRPSDAMTPETLEFFSPCQAFMARPAYPIATRCVAIIGTMMAVLVWICVTFNIDRIASGEGRIASLVPETVIAPFATGIVKTIAVSAGDIVRKGQLLAQLDQTFAAADNTMAIDQVDRYQTEVDRLTAELHQVPYHPKQLTAGALVQEGIFAQRAAARDAELRYYKGQLDSERALEKQAEENVRQYAKETGVNMDVEKIRSKLEADAVGSRLDTLAAVNQRLESEREVLSFVQQMESARQGVASLQGQLDNYNQQWFADVSQTLTDDDVQLATYRDQLEHAALNYKLIDLRAQEDSIVLSVAPVSPGSVVSAGQTFFTLVPINAPMEVDAQITADQTGWLTAGMQADIKFQTFNFAKFGQAHGAVKTVSADSFLTGASSSAVTGTPSGTQGNAVYTGVNPTSQYFYDVRVSIDRLALKHVPADFHIVPGMPVQVDVKVGDRTIWDYLVEKILPIFEQGMREPD